MHSAKKNVTTDPLRFFCPSFCNLWQASNHLLDQCRDAITYTVISRHLLSRMVQAQALQKAILIFQRRAEGAWSLTSREHHRTQLLGNLFDLCMSSETEGRRKEETKPGILSFGDMSTV